MRIRLSVAAMVALSASPTAAQRLGPREIDTLPSRAPERVAPYGPDSLQFGELRLPGGAGPFPVAIVIHGGCWTKGFATVKNTAAIASDLSTMGSPRGTSSIDRWAIPAADGQTRFST